MSNYTYMNEDHIDPELLCIVCKKPLQSPVNCIRCGETFCKQCQNARQSTQSSCLLCQQRSRLCVPVITRIVLNQLDRLLVQCMFCQERNIQRVNFSDHITYRCSKQIVKCTDKCGWKGLRENLETHLTACRRKPYLIKIFSYWSTSACVKPTDDS